MDVLSFDNIYGEQDYDNLFEPDESSTSEGVENPEEKQDETEKTEKEKTTEVDPENLFDSGEEKPESVGSGKKEDTKEKEDTPPEGGGASPTNFYSSITKALVVDGILLNLDEESAEKVADAEALSEVIEAEVNARLDEKQRRVSKALENGAEPSEVRGYENAIKFLDSVKESAITEESEKGEQLRYKLIYQSYLNAGMSEEKADKLTMRSIESGNDVDDAKEALVSNKEFFQKKYKKYLEDAEAAAEESKAERQKSFEKMKKSIMEDKTLLDGLEISADVRKKALDNVSRPTYRDPETGEYMTAIQKYEAENHPDFVKYVGLLFTMTNGFKDFKVLAKAEVNKERKRGLKELEQVINGTKRNSDGSLKLVTTVKDDPESYFDQGYKLDI